MYIFGFYLGSQWHLPYGYMFLLVVSLGIISTLILPFVQKYELIKDKKPSHMAIACRDGFLGKIVIGFLSTICLSRLVSN